MDYFSLRAADFMNFGIDGILVEFRMDGVIVHVVGDFAEDDGLNRFNF